MTFSDVAATIRPLRCIFWGGLLCVFDFTFSQTVNGSGFKIDVLNDAVGVALIAWGVFRLASLPVHDRYTKVMTFVKIVGILALVDAIRDHWIAWLPPVIEFVLALLGLATLVAVVAFCVAMRWLCESAALPGAARSWRFTTILFVAIYLVPLGFFYIASAVAIAAESSYHIDLGPAGVLLLPVFAWPVVHLFISTSRMKRAAESQLSA